MSTTTGEVNAGRVDQQLTDRRGQDPPPSHRSRGEIERTTARPDHRQRLVVEHR